MHLNLRLGPAPSVGEMTSALPLIGIFADNKPLLEPSMPSVLVGRGVPGATQLQASV